MKWRDLSSKPDNKTNNAARIKWKDTSPKVDNTTKRYDYFVIKVHKLYEEMFSVQQRVSGNLDKSWPIYLTLSGIITHGDKWFLLKTLTASEIYDMVSLYIVKKYFDGNSEIFKKAKYSLRKDWEKASENIEDYINATSTGRKIPIKDLIEYYIMLEKIKINLLYRPFFKHKSYEEYRKEALAYFNKRYKLPPHKLKDVIYEEAKRLKL